MANSKQIDIPGIGPVKLMKRRQNRTMRLSIRRGQVYVSLPLWTPYSAGISFAASHAVWVTQELKKQRQPVIENGQRIGKLHSIRFEQVLNGRAITSRVTGTEVVIRMQLGEHSDDSAVQDRAATAAIRALKREAEQLLPRRLQHLAQQNGLSYSSVAIKQLQRRWGSCDSKQAISLNLYLMELPWEYIDYVLLHELAHTKQMNHGPDFWRLLVQLCPAARDISKQLRSRQPALVPSAAVA